MEQAYSRPTGWKDKKTGKHMKLQTLRSMDYLEWLKQEEEFLVYSIECFEAVGDMRSSVEAGENLQIVRELKELVTDYGKNDWEQRYGELVEVVAQRTSQDKK